MREKKQKTDTHTQTNTTFALDWNKKVNEFRKQKEKTKHFDEERRDIC